MATFRKGSSGSPFQTEYQANKGMDTGDAQSGADKMPRVGPGSMGKKVGSGDKSSKD